MKKKIHKKCKQKKIKDRTLGDFEFLFEINEGTF